MMPSSPGLRADDALPKHIRAGYALGSLATGAFATVPGLLLLPYLTDTLGIGAALAGLLVLAPKAWDVLVNPVAGRLSDQTRTRWGARRPYVIGAGTTLAALFALMFVGPFGAGADAAAYVAVAFLAAATAFAFFQVPYIAMIAEMTDAYAERTRLSTWRIAVLALAILVSGALAPVVRDAAGGGLPGYRWMGVFVAVLIALGAVGAFLGTRHAPLGQVTESEPTLRAQLAVAGRNRPFRLLLACFVIQAAGTAAMLAGVQYFADHVMHDHGATTALFACFVGPALLVMPVWIRVGDRIGKLRGFAVASALFAAAALVLAAAATAGPVPVYLVTTVMGAGYAGQQVFALAMLPDCIAHDERRTGRRQAGVFTGLWTAGETFGLALGPGIFGLVLAGFGYVSSSTGTAAAQSDRAELGVLLGFTVLPALLMGGALVLLRGYDLPAERVAVRSQA